MTVQNNMFQAPSLNLVILLVILISVIVIAYYLHAILDEIKSFTKINNKETKSKK